MIQASVEQSNAECRRRLAFSLSLQSGTNTALSGFLSLLARAAYVIRALLANSKTQS